MRQKATGKYRTVARAELGKRVRGGVTVIFTLENIITSLAAVLRAGYPEYPVYDSPTPQDTEYPCFYIFSCRLPLRDRLGIGI